MIDVSLCSVYDAGHAVVGVEVVEQAVQEFFTENKLEYTVEKLDKIKGSLYKVNKKLDRVKRLQIDLATFQHCFCKPTQSKIENYFSKVWCHFTYFLKCASPPPYFIGAWALEIETCLLAPWCL